MVYGLPPAKGGHQTAQSQNMIQVPMGEQNFVQAAKAQTAFEELPLGSLTTVY
jgi:hypothetical protein